MVHTLDASDPISGQPLVMEIVEALVEATSLPSSSVREYPVAESSTTEIAISQASPPCVWL